MSNPPASDPLWPSVPGSSSIPNDLETKLVTALIHAETALTALALVAFIVASTVLIFRTKAKGRHLILSGIILLGILFAHSWFSMRSLEMNSVVSIATVKSGTALAFSLMGLGYARLVWFLYRSGHAKGGA